MTDFIDRLSGASADRTSDKMADLLRTLYRARPFTKAVPFNQTLTDQPFALWQPSNSYFEVGKVLVKGDSAGVDLAFCDSVIAQPFLFAITETTQYREFDLDPGYRSLLYNNAQLLVFDAANTGVTVKGVIYGWEVDPRGFYR